MDPKSPNLRALEFGESWDAGMTLLSNILEVTEADVKQCSLDHGNGRGVEVFQPH